MKKIEDIKGLKPLRRRKTKLQKRLVKSTNNVEKLPARIALATEKIEAKLAEKPRVVE